MIDLEKSILKYKLTTGIDLEVTKTGVLHKITIPSSYISETLELPSFIRSINLHSCNCNTNSIRKVILPKKLTKCNDFDIMNWHSIKSVSLGSVNTIGTDFVSMCESLKTFDFDIVSTISDYAFQDCFNLEEFDFSKIKEKGTVGIQAFESCIHLSELKGLDKCKNVVFRDNCFQCCHGITKVHLSGNCTFNYRCFYECKNLEEIEIDNGVLLHERCFEACTGLKHVIIKDVGSVLGLSNLFLNCPKETRFELWNSPSMVDASIYTGTLLGRPLIEHGELFKFENIVVHTESYHE